MKLPYKKGESRANSISNVEAVELAVRYGAVIEYDEMYKVPFSGIMMKTVLNMKSGLKMSEV